MKYALISDTHGNLPALEAVLEDMGAREETVAIYHLGDLVGYAPWPNEVADALRERAIPGVAGNYDSTTATDYKHCGCRYEDPRQEELLEMDGEAVPRSSCGSRTTWTAPRRRSGIATCPMNSPITSRRVGCR